jgi:hypothetical protein
MKIGPFPENLVVTPEIWLSVSPTPATPHIRSRHPRPAAASPSPPACISSIFLCTSTKHPGYDFNLLHNWFEISNKHTALQNGVLLVIFWFIVVVIFSPFYSVAWLLDNQFCMCIIQSFFLRITI